MKLRDYQQAAVDAVLKTWQKNRSCLIVLPTGCGKTVVFGEVIRRRLAEAAERHLREYEADAMNTDASEASGNHAMILAHREELINQAVDKVGNITAATVDVEMGPREIPEMFGRLQLPSVVVSSVQTQITGRMKKFDPDLFDTLVIDEAHHATSKSYRMCVEHYLKNPACRLLGVTATPDRADETALGIVFESVAYEYSVDQAIRDGWLVPVRQKMVTVGSLDYSQVSTTAGDFNSGELGQILEEEQNLHGIASPTIEICGKRRAIIFATTVRQAERLAEIINRTAKDSAAWVCGKTPKNEREDILEQFKAGKLQYIVNVGVLTEGFDDSGVEVVVMARPTKSRALYAQMAGRGTRPAAEIAAKLGEVGEKGTGNREQGTETPQEPLTTHNSSLIPTPAERRRQMIAKSKKPCCLIVDFVGNSGRHKLVTAIDILGGKELDPDEEAAKEIVRRKCEEAGNEGLDPQEELEKAREKVRQNKIEEAKRRAFIKLKAKYSVVTVDPFNVYDLPPVPLAEKCALDRRRPSFKQAQLCRERIGVNPDNLRYSEVKGLIDAYFGRRERGLATLRQTKYLRRNGLTMPMSFKEASATIGRLLEKKR